MKRNIIKQAFITTKQAEELVNMSAPTVKQYAKECGGLYKIGGTVRIDKAKLLRYMREIGTYSKKKKKSMNPEDFASVKKGNVATFYDKESNQYMLAIKAFYGSEDRGYIGTIRSETAEQMLESIHSLISDLLATEEKIEKWKNDGGV